MKVMDSIFNAGVAVREKLTGRKVTEEYRLRGKSMARYAIQGLLAVTVLSLLVTAYLAVLHMPQ